MIYRLSFGPASNVDRVHMNGWRAAMQILDSFGSSNKTKHASSVHQDLSASYRKRKKYA
jgi:hypothetical protein